MARIPLSKQKKIAMTCIVIYRQIMVMIMATLLQLMYLLSITNIKVPKPISFVFDDTLENRITARILNVRPMIQGSDIACLDNLRMDRACFYKLCEMLRDVGKLQGNRNTSLDEMVALFLFTLSHDTKIEEFAVTKNCQDDRWKWFKNCLGALDGTHFKVRVGDKDKVRFRNRKGDLTTNVFAACTRDMQFIYLLPSWEGSAHDNRVLHDALSRQSPLKVLKVNYYLCDAECMNCEGFLTPFRGQRYHLSIWKSGALPVSAGEYFNMKHSQARNVIERCFGLLNMRWGILRQKTWYPRKTVSRIILACALVHNFIRTYMSIDPMESLLEDNIEDDGDNIEIMETSGMWNAFRQELANDMYNAWIQSRNT
uniref:DDE Tnp4 domain-containing protein n=1 Tax=Chenopodium quinoa TaxID=63459 RepID=A0A803NDS7_CHEQI